MKYLLLLLVVNALQAQVCILKKEDLGNFSIQTFCIDGYEWIRLGGGASFNQKLMNNYDYLVAVSCACPQEKKDKGWFK